ncbi:hypothetical protein AMAG_10935 [Allomyces macrogynus ATCC 38327]|uniref:Mediator of RNA polymerase II transcription subunit 17 n=1 Tax=Allomyces macrogynus (strain ATCC 38327) TaxID=578462 RepID=A0A0L0SRV7_ALLM3|nr:hypothetical protein AMAG_10935 [Allomyces macrogynus ATCC 38327]|eukprot:KNE65293.1 hypothetical protein AMAG_10935 [Allomyces macrogynus ATCC 38327]
MGRRRRRGGRVERRGQRCSRGRAAAAGPRRRARRPSVPFMPFTNARPPATMDPPASAPETAPPAAVPAKRPAPTANTSTAPPAKRQAGAVTVTSLHDHALDLLDIHNDATHILAPKETPTQRLIARIRHLDFQQLAPHDEDDEDDDEDDEADGAAKTDQEDHDHDESDDDDDDDDHAMSVATSRAPTTAVSTAAAASSAPALDQVAKSPEEMERLGAELIQHLDMASHEIWALRELVNLLLESPTVPPGVPPTHAHLFKVVHPIHFPKPRMPAAARLDETAFASAAKQSHLTAGAALLRRGARSLRASLRAEHAFFVDEALPLRDRNWRLRLRTDVAVDARGPTRVFGGGMYVDYRYDQVEAACAPAARERLPAPPRAELLRVLRDQVVGKDKEMVSVADGLQVTLGAGGGDPQRIRVAWIGGEGIETTDAASKDAVAVPTTTDSPAPATPRESKVDVHLRAAQETYYHRLLFAQLCEDAATVPNVSHRGKSLVVSLGAHGGVAITLGPPPATPSLEEHVLARGTSLSRFVEWLQFTHASRAVVETVAHTAHAIMPWTSVRVATRRVPAARDADEGLVARVEVPATGAELDLAVHPPAEMTVRIPASGRHVVVGDVAQVAQLVQYQVADEVRALVREKAKALGVRRRAAGDGEDDEEEGAEGSKGGAVKVHVEWPGEDEVGKPARIVVDGVAAPGGSGWVERALLLGGSSHA